MKDYNIFRNVFINTLNKFYRVNNDFTLENLYVIINMYLFYRVEYTIFIFSSAIVFFSSKIEGDC